MEKIKLVLEDNTVFRGYSFGYNSSVAGEVVFNTGMVGYPESLTDPSYRGQILVLTYPLIGNYGVPSQEKEGKLMKFFESEKIHITGLIISDYSKDYSHWNAQQSLSSWLVKNKVPGICGIDTRALTQKLREKGVMLGKVVFEKDIPFEDPNTRNLVNEVSCSNPIVYENGKTKILLIDCGVKYNIIRSILKRKCSVIRVPWNYDFSDTEYEGVIISNGPGDPKLCTKTIENVKKLIKEKTPVFGVCLGNQILALAAGADTYKLKYGHRSQNQPCIKRKTKRCYITSQNHGFAVDNATLPKEWEEWFYNANDGTNEGIIHKSGLFRSVQFHPEATPGPVDTEHLFDEFLELIRKK
ncbi:glutamine-hydrolyzing carbamoyl-phosphate synthase small subunit [Candidatus Woesearchaeota archaeon]|nr:glutamine-hydrolyzing carbamoyl-phosphate synthase small subunit [Candidatus Woesearchaeota archaeon]